ncbi:ABC transporter permease [Bradyrhizobium sp. SSUT18]|uniref:ABC transporter permease n=1 Tax=Bradyrhizobium sp. SSUT18 TaxID=3040602 RepID=UPI00244A1D77|nr:ABC transporter permease [Bradyrhizobium sp. SSUT18]MDH2398382.1 ABC transporter permease [Bradyrhizobium sp. SSUT18]
MMTWLNRPASITQVTHRQRIWLYAFAVLTLIFLILPTLIVVPMSFSGAPDLEFPPRDFSLRWYEHYFYSTEWMTSTLISFRVAIITMVAATSIGTAAAYGIWAGSTVWRSFLLGLFALPMTVPVILVAVGSLFVLARLGLVNTTLGLSVVHTALALPIVVIIVTAGLASYDGNQEQAARSLGATRLRAFFTVTLPQIRASVLSATLFSFFTSFDEVVVAMFISNGSAATLNRRMFNALRDQVDPTIAAISSCLIGVTIVLIFLSQAFKAPVVR